MLEIGKTYKVKIDDCCVQGEFVSTLVNFDEDTTSYEFSNGVQLWSAWGVGLEEVKE